MGNMLSVITPAYNESSNISVFADTIKNVLDGNNIDYEIIIVNDGSTDGTWNEIITKCASSSCVKGISFSRNFGKEAAIMAGLEAAQGDCCVVIDCDLQHPPSKILEMYSLWRDGYEIVEGIKSNRGKEMIIKSYATKLFYSLISRATGYDMKNASDYKLLDRKAVDALLCLPERGVFFRALSSWIGFKTTRIYYDVEERMYGETKWTTGRLVKYAISNITAFSSNLMQLITVFGVIMAVVSVVFSAIALFRKFMHMAVDGFTTVIILLMFSSSLIMISLGIIGYYLAKMYDEIKARPRYIVTERIGYDEDEN